MGLKTPGIIKTKVRNQIELLKKEGFTLIFQSYLDKKLDKSLIDIEHIEKSSYIRMVNQDKQLTKKERNLLVYVSKFIKNKNIYTNLDLNYTDYNLELEKELIKESKNKLEKDGY